VRKIAKIRERSKGIYNKTQNQETPDQKHQIHKIEPKSERWQERKMKSEVEQVHLPHIGIGMATCLGSGVEGQPRQHHRTWGQLTCM